jgi:hypothetical protein
MTPTDDDAQQRELDSLRAEAEALGFRDEGPDPAFEDADDFIARMKKNDVTHLHGRSRAITRTPARILAGIVVAAAAAIIAVVALRPTSSPVVADTPPVLDYEFAAAVRIAFAPGENPEESLDILAEAAAATATSPDLGSIQHHVTDNWFSDQDEQGSSVITPRVTETWLEPNGSLTTVDSIGTQLRSDGRGIPTSPPEYSGKPNTDRLPAGSVDADFPSTLSTNPDTLREQLLEHGGCAEETAPSSARSFCLYNEIRALFTTYVIEPDLAAAMWASLRGEEGFTSLGSVEDRAGRNGLGISFIGDQRPQYRFVLIGSTETGQLLGTEELVIKSDPDLEVDPPAVISFTTITTANRVNSLG